MDRSAQINEILDTIEGLGRFNRGGDLVILRRQLEDLGHEISVCLCVVADTEENILRDKYRQ